MATVTVDEGKKLREQKMLAYTYSLGSFAAGISMTYFPTYLSMLYTDIYLMPLALSAFLGSVTQFTTWIAGPLWGATVVDRVTLKIGKYWPWILLGSVVVSLSQMAIFSLPAVSTNPAGLATLVFVMAIMQSIGGVMQNTTRTSIYPQLADSPKDRTWLAMAQTVGRTGAKTVFGFLVPIWLVYFTTKGGSDASGWAWTALIIGSLTMILNIVFPISLRNSSIEQEAKAKMRGEGSILKAFKGLATNRALLVMFLVWVIMKVGDLGFQTNGASYFWRYYMKDMASMSKFMMFRSLAQAFGAAFGLVWLKQLKDSRRAFIAAGILDIAILAVATVALPNLSSMNYIILMSVGQFFRGLEEAYILPFFAAAVDWGTWKTGVKAHGLNMAVYSLCTSLSGLIGTWLRTALFSATGYNAAAYAKGEVPSAAVLGVISNMAVGYTLGLIALSIAIFIFGFHINDSKLKEIKDELKARDQVASTKTAPTTAG